MPDSIVTSDASVRVSPADQLEPEAGLSLGPWPQRAICNGEDPERFFPSHGDPGTKARGICAHCPVQQGCLEYATEADEFGIWGGLDREQRRALRRELAMNCADEEPLFFSEEEGA
jgi:WhiB family transcriptional regulator, redox-sensing transcriptional regulator